MATLGAKLQAVSGDCVAAWKVLRAALDTDEGEMPRDLLMHMYVVACLYLPPKELLFNPQVTRGLVSCTPDCSTSCSKHATATLDTLLRLQECWN